MWKNMEGVCLILYEAVEVEAGGCAGSRCLEEWHFGEPPSPWKRGNTDVKPVMIMMLMMMMMIVQDHVVECLLVTLKD